ncbi:hypothetical protein [Streptomyces sp. NPDC059016]|uniref:hypothetical protein n=1 Tax=Streptomyces sp. NPDC059016 TaxID=3346699 RepID=UPI0036974B7B
MSSWFEERRADRREDAEEQRRNRAFEAELRRKERREDRDEQRADKLQARRDRAQRRQARAAKREKTLTPGNVYRKGTLILVALSALAAIPAQVAFFVKKSLMLLPVPFALEGAAWVMAAGVAYADEKKLPAWVRWLLRTFCVSAAAFAARINYLHGAAEEGVLVGWGLAAVTMLGPLFFEVRQWVLTLSAAVVNPKQRAEEKARARHEKRRRKDHKDVVDLARKLVSAAPYGALTFEEAFASAWEIKYGTRTPGMTPALHGQAHASRQALAAAIDAANGSPVSTRGRLLELLLPAPVKQFPVTESSQVVTDLPPVSKKPAMKAEKGARRQPPAHRRSKGDSLPYHAVAKTEAALERGAAPRRIPAVNGHH